MISIRAYKAQSRLENENKEILQANLEAQFISNGCRRWLDVRLSAISVALASGIAFVAVIRHHFVGNLNPALVGLSLAYSFPITSLLKNLIWSYAETEKQLVACERVFEYSTLESESELMEEVKETPAIADPSVWPRDGNIRFERFSLRYRKELPLVLKEITLEIKGGEHIGICGRTGSGKSTLYEALFRMRKFVNGSIFIDGVDITKVPLAQLRSSLCIIPQQPILVRGTIRSNLDPYNVKSDNQIWNAIKKCRLETKIRSLDKGLLAEVRSGAENFSLGERQLLTLARSFLQDAKIVCLDEATASIVSEFAYVYVFS